MSGRGGLEPPSLVTAILGLVVVLATLYRIDRYMVAGQDTVQTYTPEFLLPIQYRPPLMRN